MPTTDRANLFVIGTERTCSWSKLRTHTRLCEQCFCVHGPARRTHAPTVEQPTDRRPPVFAAIHAMARSPRNDHGHVERSDRRPICR